MFFSLVLVTDFFSLALSKGFVIDRFMSKCVKSNLIRLSVAVLVSKNVCA